MRQCKRYVINGQVFETQRALELAVRARLNSHPLNEEFHDEFLAAVINELHANVRAAGQRATGRFQYLDWLEQYRRGMESARRHRGGKLMMGFFHPLGEWRDVSVYPWKAESNSRTAIKKALREKINQHLPRPSQSDRCTRQPCSARGFDLEYEHVRPTFNEIAEECLLLMSDEEIATRFGYSKFSPGLGELCDLLDDEHPAVRRLYELHSVNEWEWLCAHHHRNVAPCLEQLLLPA
jgi:hypothetical protein